MLLRPLQATDNAAIAAVIRTVSAEFGLAPSAGFAVADATLDDLYGVYGHEAAAYWVVENEAGIVVGGGGVAPLQGAPEILEIQKMYFLPEARGQGLAKSILLLCFAFGEYQGKTVFYLETTANLQQAISLYEKLGFVYLDTPLGNTGHSAACEIYMHKQI